MADRVRIRNLTIYRPIIYGNTAYILSDKEREKNATNPSLKDHTHRWTVAVRSAASAPDSDQVGGADDLSHFIRRVTFKLHDTYPNPSRVIDKAPFEVTETGWGEFEVQIRIQFVAEAAEKTMTLFHHLKLHPWTITGEAEVPPLDVAIKAGPVHSWQYDEVVFNDPYSNFLTMLTQHPPTPLPVHKRKPVPFHLTNPKSLEASKGGTPEFNQAMEKEEAARLIDARKAILAERERWEQKVREKEQELDRLKKELEGLK
ncbi:hypothetical protein CVT24_005791 [Panaeolus cyanescens]|uniref:Protein AF-9 homolog n=1 Tax=Panaeolus cyanescens TaxID=181874 RepID=A0A409V930_9AGAR|nr:hypothetical protein CVT24_005791 [Panaeolus cyanescens]